MGIRNSFRMPAGGWTEAEVPELEMLLVNVPLVCPGSGAAELLAAVVVHCAWVSLGGQPGSPSRKSWNV